MGLPSTLKNFNLFNEGTSYMGKVNEVNLPKLKRKMEDHRAGGMNGTIKLDYGMEGMQMDWTCAGMMRQVLEQFGTIKHDGVMLRFAGAYQAEDSTTPDSIEVIVRGRHSEVDMGGAKPADKTALKVTTEVSYYKMMINGDTVIEIDIINMVEMINGIDNLEKIRAAIGI